MTVAEDGTVYAGETVAAEALPPKSKEETHVIKQCKESL